MSNILKEAFKQAKDQLIRAFDDLRAKRAESIEGADIEQYRKSNRGNAPFPEKWKKLIFGTRLFDVNRN